MLKISLCMICAFLSVTSYAQKVKIEKKSLEIIENQLVIIYDFIKSKKHQTFNVWLEIETSKGRKINASSLSGDVGKNVIGGENKKIVWDYNKDGIIMGADEEIYVEVVANINKVGSSFGQTVLLSAIVPGLGLSKLEKGKPYWLMGVATYGAIGASYLLNKQAVTDYNSYLTEEDTQTSKDLYKSSESKSGFSKTMAYTAVGIWTVNMIWTIIKAKKSGNSVAGFSNKKVLFYTGVDPRSKTAGFSIKYRF